MAHLDSFMKCAALNLKLKKIERALNIIAAASRKKSVNPVPMTIIMPNRAKLTEVATKFQKKKLFNKNYLIYKLNIEKPTGH